MIGKHILEEVSMMKIPILHDVQEKKRVLHFSINGDIIDPIVGAGSATWAAGGR